MKTTEKPASDTRSVEKYYERLMLHFCYCGLIAVMIVVFVVTDRWTNKGEFTAYLSNAATMTSLLLGVVAIFYSLISNDGMSRSLGSIHTVTEEVRQVRSDIERFAQQTRTSTETAAENNELVKAASIEMSGNKRSLDETLVTLSSQNNILKNLAESFPGRMDQLENKFEDVSKSMYKPSTQQGEAVSQPIIGDDVVERFLKRAPLRWNLLILACVLSEEKKRPLDISKLCAVIEWNAPFGFRGFLGCMAAIQLCAIEQTDE